MILKNGSFEEMARQIEQKKQQIVIFGAGMIGRVTTLAILKKHNLENRVSFYVDNDPDKAGNTKGGYEVRPVERLKEVNGDRTVILLAVSRFADSLAQLENFKNLEHTACFLIPMMCITNFRPSGENLIQKDSKVRRIPKIIHYMWLGGQKIPAVLLRCMESWKKYCPDYEIRCWDESNYDINKNSYMREAYRRGMYGFVPDYARLDILYTYGGIYLDTDVELIKGLDDMLYQEAFCCVEKWQNINFGGGSGAVKGSRAIGELLKTRAELAFIDEKGNINKNTCGYYDTLALQKFGYKICGGPQKILDMNIYPYEVFHPYDYMSKRTARSVNTHGIHHFNGGWLDESMRRANQKTAEEFEEIYQRTVTL
ncbi:MAG: hypothetical protein HFE84_10160 [Lachnospiraceae bacterium]|nr:hypothetical protein [Lachnospiraceae bacterium]